MIGIEAEILPGQLGGGDCETIGTDVEEEEAVELMVNDGIL